MALGATDMRSWHQGAPSTSRDRAARTVWGANDGQRAIEQRSAEVQAAWQAPTAIGKPLPGPEVLYIEADGAWVNSRERLHMEGKVGLVHQGPEPVGRNRMQLRSALYVTTFEESERLGEEKRTVRGWSRPSLSSC